MFDIQTARILYRKLLSFYPQRFKEQLGESMEQTFNDLYRERQRDHRLFTFTVWTFIETSVGIVREHVLLMSEGDSMRAILSNPRSAAITSFMLCLPIGLLFMIFNLDIKPLTEPIVSLLTVNGSDVNGLGRKVLIAGMLLVPVAFIINLLPLLKKEGRRTLPIANIIVGAVILLILAVTWGGLLLEGIYCLQGIRCD
jgi:hypothetical protein